MDTIVCVLGALLLCVDAEASLLAREVVLSADVEVTVPAGETNEIYALSGGAYTLAKTGGGVLKIADIASADVKIDHLVFREDRECRGP